MTPKLLATVLNRLGGWIPSQCAVCGTMQSDPICKHCQAAFSQTRWRCVRCAVRLASDLGQCGECIANPPPLDICYAAVSYEFPWSRLVVDFKFRDQTAWAISLANMMHDVLGVRQTLQEADALVPMPLSTERLTERGYNQSLLLAKVLAQGPVRAMLATPIWASTLLRVKDTPPQSAQNRQQRLRNLNGTLVVDPLKTTQVHGQNIVLVDDVMTTGASLYTAAKALRSAGAAQVSAVVFARTEM